MVSVALISSFLGLTLPFLILGHKAHVDARKALLTRKYRPTRALDGCEVL